MAVASRRIGWIWLVLLLATAVTWWLGESGLSDSAGALSVTLMFALAFVKGRLVILDFMELDRAPPLWRRLMLGWLAGVVGMILLAWWFGRV